MGDGEKVSRIIQLFEQGMAAQEVAKKIGYAHVQSLSRFMSKYNYRWDRQKQNYIYDNAPNTNKGTGDNPINEKKAEKEQDVLDLLEKDSVIELLKYSQEIVDLYKRSVQSNNKSNLISQDKRQENQESFWKKAQRYNYSSEPCLTKSFRINLQLENQLNEYTKKTNLTQKQIICLALDEFFNNYAKAVD